MLRRIAKAFPPTTLRAAFLGGEYISSQRIAVVYALPWFLINDRVKLRAYRIFDPNETPLLVKPAAVTAASARI